MARRNFTLRYLSHRLVGGSSSLSNTVWLTVEGRWITGWWWWKKRHSAQWEYVKMPFSARWTSYPAGEECDYSISRTLQGLYDVAVARKELEDELDREIAGADKVIPIRKRK